MSVKKPVIDLGYRPQSYFWPITHDTHVIAAIKGERRRSAIRNAFDADRVTPLDELYASPTLPDEDRRALGRLHPSFMGGEYLPDRRDTEVEIARINIDSTTSDVTSVYAKAGTDRIRYRVVDEYNGDTLSEKRTRSSKRPSSEVYPQFEAARSIPNNQSIATKNQTDFTCRTRSTLQRLLRETVELRQVCHF